MSGAFPAKPASLVTTAGASILRGQVGWWVAPQSGTRTPNLMDQTVATVNSGATASSMRGGSCYSLDGGANSYLDAGSTNRFLSNTSPFTFAWLQVQASGFPTYQGIASFFPTGATNPFIILRTTDTGNYGVFAFQKRVTGSSIPSINVSALSLANSVGKLQMWVLTGQNGMNSTTPGDFTVYVIDFEVPSFTKLVAGPSNAGISANTTASNTLGWDNADSKAIGKFDNFRLWNRVLSDAEVWSFMADPYAGGRIARAHWASGLSGTLKTYNGLGRANLKTLNGVAIGSVKTYDGLTG